MTSFLPYYNYTLTIWSFNLISIIYKSGIQGRIQISFATGGGGGGHIIIKHAKVEVLCSYPFTHFRCVRSLFISSS